MSPSKRPTDDHDRKPDDGLPRGELRGQSSRDRELDAGYQGKEPDLDSTIVESIQRLYPSHSAPASHLAELRARVDVAPSIVRPLVRWCLIGGMATAASLFLAISISWFNDFSPRPTNGYSYNRTPLATLYRRSVNRGFNPDYECHDLNRFTRVFNERLGRPVYLLPMPRGRRMTGLSYVGGLSMKTIVMLCVVDGEPVMVFVDHAQNDWSGAADQAEQGIRSFRKQRDGLVFYEITPFDQPKATEFLSVRIPSLSR